MKATVDSFTGTDTKLSAAVKGGEVIFEKIPEFLVNPEDEEDGFEIRCLRNAIGRLKEWDRQKLAGNVSDDNAVLATGHLGEELKELYDSLSKSGRVDFAVPPTQMRARLTKAKFDAEESLKQMRMNKWRTKLRNSIKEAFRWVKAIGEPVSHCIFDSKLDKNGDATQNFGAAIRCITNAWQRVWNRTLVPTDETMRLISGSLGPPSAPQHWDRPDAYELWVHAAHMAGKAAGLDGWTGTEVSLFTLQMWETIHAYIELCVSNKVAPRHFKMLRQAELQKPGKKKRDDGATDAWSLRPVSIYSVIWRNWSATLHSSEHVQQWLLQWMPNAMRGGKRGEDIVTSLLETLNETDKARFLGTIDYSLAFDHADPELVLKIFALLGMPDWMISMLEQLWLDQWRLVQYGGESAVTWNNVNSSLPQGDSWAMDGMGAMLLAPLLSLQQKWPSAFHSLFVDDREWITDNAEDCIQIREDWRGWSVKLGLLENEDKDQFFHKTGAGREKLVTEGAEPDTVSSTAKILGVCMAGSKNRPCTDSENKKIAEGCRVARKAWFLPRTHWDKLIVACAAGISKASWGWLARAPGFKDCDTLDLIMAKVASEPITQRSPALSKIMRGHSASLSFKAGMQLASAAWKFAKKTGLVPADWTTSIWTNTLRKFFEKLNWDEEQPWQWRHLNIENAVTYVSLDPSSAHFHGLGKYEHLVRDSWRATQFFEWLQSGRVDAKDCAGTTFNSTRCKLTREFAKKDRHYWMVSIGAMVSPARFHQMKVSKLTGPQMAAQNTYFCCPWCGLFKADANHVTWECTQNGRPTNLVPRDKLQRRLGWFTTDRRRKDMDSGIARWMAHVREKILNIRYDHVDGLGAAGG